MSASGQGASGRAASSTLGPWRSQGGAACAFEIGRFAATIEIPQRVCYVHVTFTCVCVKVNTTDATTGATALFLKDPVFVCCVLRNTKNVGNMWVQNELICRFGNGCARSCRKSHMIHTVVRLLRHRRNHAGQRMTPRWPWRRRGVVAASGLVYEDFMD